MKTEFSYQQLSRKRIFIIWMAVILCIAAFAGNVLVGSSGTAPVIILKGIFFPDQVDMRIRAIIWSMRLPMGIMGVLVGGALGASGAVMQTILNNPLASPYTLDHLHPSNCIFLLIYVHSHVIAPILCPLDRTTLHLAFFLFQSFPITSKFKVINISFPTLSWSAIFYLMLLHFPSSNTDIAITISSTFRSPEKISIAEGICLKLISTISS